MRFFKSRSDDGVSDWALMRWADFGADIGFESFCILRTPLGMVALNFHRKPNLSGEMHNHPWSFLSFVIKGSYTEVTGTEAGDRLINTRFQHVDFSSFRRHDEPHGIVGVEPGGCTTLMFTGPHRKKLWTYFDCTTTPGKGDVTFLKRLP